MASMIDRIEELEMRMQFIEEQFGITKQNRYSEKPKKLPTPEPVPEQTINGFSKEQLKVMYSWAKGMRLNQITRGDYEELKKWGMLWEFYPDAPNTYEEIKR
jgi:hypothetical protein